MGILRASRMLGRLEDGLMSSAQLETLLATTAGKSDFWILLSQRGQVSRMAGVAATAAAIGGSSTAVDMLAQQSLALSRFFDNPVAIDSLIASSSFAALAVVRPVIMKALTQVPGLPIKLWGSDMWLTALTGHSDSLIDVAATTTVAVSSNGTKVSFGFGSKVILLSSSYFSQSPYMCTIAGRRAGSFAGLINLNMYGYVTNVIALEASATFSCSSYASGNITFFAFPVS